MKPVCDKKDAALTVVLRGATAQASRNQFIFNNNDNNNLN